MSSKGAVADPLAGILPATIVPKPSSAGVNAAAIAQRAAASVLAAKSAGSSPTVAIKASAAASPTAVPKPVVAPTTGAATAVKAPIAKPSTNVDDIFGDLVYVGDGLGVDSACV